MSWQTILLAGTLGAAVYSDAPWWFLVFAGACLGVSLMADFVIWYVRRKRAANT